MDGHPYRARGVATDSQGNLYTTKRTRGSGSAYRRIREVTARGFPREDATAWRTMSDTYVSRRRASRARSVGQVVRKRYGGAVLRAH
jgi:hypothetical protein